jgi:hypothetical protein
MCLQYIIIRFTPSSFSDISLLPLLRTISHVLLFYFYTYTKLTHHIHPPTLSPFNLLPPTGTHFQTEPILPFCLSIFYKYIDYSTGLNLGISHMYMLYFNQINLLYYLLFLYCPAAIIQELSVQFVTHLHTQI